MAAIEAKDAYTAGHSSKVAEMSFRLARRLRIKGKQLEDIHMAAHLHDIGKISVPTSILNKKGTLLPHERAQVELHPEIGYKIISPAKSLRSIAQIVLHHHERWDGKGYPQGLAGERIPLGARIIALTDAIDAMTSHRPYRQAMSWEACQLEVSAAKGRQFDPVLVDACESLWGEWKLLRAANVSLAG